MGRAPQKSAGGSRAGEEAARSQEFQELAFALADKELENRKLKEENAEYKRKYDDLTLTLKQLAEGAGHVALPAAVAASGAPRELDEKDTKKKGAFLQDKNFHLKVHHRQGKPVVADAFGMIHEKVEDPGDRKRRLARERYHRDKRLIDAVAAAALAADAASGARRTDDSSGLAAIGGGDAAAGARRTDDSSGASCARAQGSAGGQSSSASGGFAAALEAEAAALEAEAAAAEAEAEAAEAEAAEAAEADEDAAPEEPPSKKTKF